MEPSGAAQTLQIILLCIMQLGTVIDKQLISYSSSEQTSTLRILGDAPQSTLRSSRIIMGSLRSFLRIKM